MAAPVINLSAYQPVAVTAPSVGTALGSTGGAVTTPSTPTPSSSLSVLNTSNPAGLPASTGITNQNLLPSYLRTATAPVSPVTKTTVPAFGSAATAAPAPAASATNIDTNYFMQPGETPEAYNTRIAAYNESLGGTTPVSLANGGTASVDSTGNVVSPSSFTINSSSAIPSDALTSEITPGDVNNTQGTYSSYVNGLATAQQYSPTYLSALQAYQNTQNVGAELNANLADGNAPGDTVDYAQGATARAEALNNEQALSATNAMQVAELVRQGNIAGATALVQAAQPTSVSPGSSLVSPLTGNVAYGGTTAYTDLQAEGAYSSLQTEFPDANIPAYDPTQSAQQNLQNAQTAAAASPSFQARNLVQVTLPGGGISFVNRNQIQTNADGTYSLISSPNATTASAASSAIQSLTSEKAQIQTAVQTADANFPLLLNVVKKAGINDLGSPLANQLGQAVNNKLIGSGDMASFNALVTSLGATYSQILSRGGQVTDNTRNEAAALVNGNISYNALSDLYTTLKAESANVLQGYTTSISQYQNQLSSSTGAGATPGSGSSAYIDPSQASW